MPTPPTEKAFISYSGDDSKFAVALAKDLKSRQMPVWIDELDIYPGQHVARATEEALQAAAAVIVVLSPSAVKSDDVLNSIRIASALGKPVIPVLYRDCEFPPKLRGIKYVDFRNDYDAGLDYLLRAMGAPPASPAPATQSYGSSSPASPTPGAGWESPLRPPGQYEAAQAPSASDAQRYTAADHATAQEAAAHAAAAQEAPGKYAASPSFSEVAARADPNAPAYSFDEPASSSYAAPPQQEEQPSDAPPNATAVATPSPITGISSAVAEPENPPAEAAPASTETPADAVPTTGIAGATAQGQTTPLPTFDVPPTPKVVSDRWVTEDALGYEAYARALASLITHPDTRPPLTIGIEAPWGAGKTSVMKMIQHVLDGQANLTEQNVAGRANRLPQSSITLETLLDKLTHPVPDTHIEPKPSVGEALRRARPGHRVVQCLEISNQRTDLGRAGALHHQPCHGSHGPRATRTVQAQAQLATS